MKNDIQKIVDDLIPLFSQSDIDKPDQSLWDHPEINHIIEIQKKIIDLLFPGKCTNKPQELNNFFIDQITEISSELKKEILKALPYNWKAASNLHENYQPVEDLNLVVNDLILRFINTIPLIRKNIIKDIEAAYNGDPAALSYAEVKLAYPGLTAIAAHRIAHELYKLSIPIIPRIMSENIHSVTGIDIHPGATIGEGFFIDHGTGVVIGETTKIGDNVKLYQGVTLGAKSFALDEHGRPIKHVQRHPTVEDNVIIYANSTILGGDTIIGKRTVIAGNVFLMISTPPDSLVTRAENGVQIRTRSTTDIGAGI